VGELTGTKHGDDANALLVFYQDSAKRLEGLGSYFMAAVALGAALETALLTFILLEQEENSRPESHIPDDLQLKDLIAAAREIDLLNAVPFGDSGKRPITSVEAVIHEIQEMRNNIHPARALRKSFNPASFNEEQYRRLRDIYGTVINNLLYHI
jgi:hypothetical protein